MTFGMVADVFIFYTGLYDYFTGLICCGAVCC